MRHRWRRDTKSNWNWPCASTPERARGWAMNPRLISRLNPAVFAMALGVIAILAPASAQTPDLAAIARASGTPEIPGLKMVWLAPWGDVAKAHAWRNIIVHQT